MVSEIVKMPYRATFVDRNQDGYMIGHHYVNDPFHEYDDGIVVSPNGTVTVIPDPDGFARSSVAAINSQGQGVREFISVYSSSELRLLREALVAEDLAAWQIQNAFALDESGVIYATAQQTGTSDTETSTYLVRLTPR
jgi:hypothetical protein